MHSQIVACISALKMYAYCTLANYEAKSEQAPEIRITWVVEFPMFMLHRHFGYLMPDWGRKSGQSVAMCNDAILNLTWLICVSS
jgi:hypothetical protein